MYAGLSRPFPRMNKAIPILLMLSFGGSVFYGASGLQHNPAEPTQNGPGEETSNSADSIPNGTKGRDGIPADSVEIVYETDSVAADTVNWDKYVTLQDMVITATKAAVVAKQDTMEFNAGSYKTAVNANVEDLLKKLPGVEVDADGNIKSNGKTVSKILVNGKEFFADDTKMATKNLPSELIDKVQVVDRKSDFSRLTGVDDGEEETVINLTVKKNMQNGWVGNINAGYGTDNRYEGAFNISTFSDKNQISIVGGANNINELGFMDRGRGRFGGFGSGGGISDAQRIGINFNVGKDENLRFGGNVFYSHSDRHATSQTETQFLLPDSTSYQHSGSDTRDRGHNVNANFRLEWKIDQYNTIDFRPTFSFNHRSSQLVDTTQLNAGDLLRTLVNSRENRSANSGNSWNAGGDLIYNHNFQSRPGRSFSIRANYNFSNTRQYTTSWNDIIYYLQQDDSELQYRLTDNRQWTNSISGQATWTEPLGDVKKGNFIEAMYKIDYRFNNADKNTYDLPVGTGTWQDAVMDYTWIPADATFNPEVSNQFRNTFVTHTLQLGYKKVSNKMNLQTGLEFSPSGSKSTDLIDAARNIPMHWVYNIAPYFRFRYRFSKTRSLRVNYRARTTSPSLTQLQPVADISDPLNIRVGNPDLKPTFTQSIRFNYNNYNEDTQQSMFAMLNGSYATNVIVSRTRTDANTGIRTTQYANANGNVNVFGMFMINQPLPNRKWRFSAALRGNYSSMAGYINDDFNRSGNLNLSPDLGMTFSCDVFQMSVRPTYSFNMATNTLATQPNRYTHTYGFRSDATLTLPFGLQFSTDLAFNKSTGYSVGFNSTTWIWNAQLSYSVLRDKSLTFSVRAYDLLGQNNNITRTVSAGQIVDARYNNLTRYVMFGVSWQFNTMKSKKTSSAPDGPIPDGGPGFGRGPGSGPMGPPPGRRPF